MNGLTTASRDRLFMSAEAVVPIALNALAAMVVAVVLACPLRWLGGSAPPPGRVAVATLALYRRRCVVRLTTEGDPRA